MTMRISRLLFTFFILLSASLSAQAQTIFPDIDVQHYTFAITLNDNNNNISGKATIAIKFLNDVSQFKLNLVKKNSSGKGMLVTEVTEDNKKLKFIQDADVVNIIASAKKYSTHSYTISYSGVPADGLIISQNKFGHRTFFGDNWPNRAHNWIPCNDHPADKASVEFIVTAPDHYQVISNGILFEETNLPHHFH